MTTNSKLPPGGQMHDLMGPLAGEMGKARKRLKMVHQRPPDGHAGKGQQGVNRNNDLLSYQEFTVAERLCHGRN